MTINAYAVPSMVEHFIYDNLNSGTLGYDHAYLTPNMSLWVRTVFCVNIHVIQTLPHF